MQEERLIALILMIIKFMDIRPSSPTALLRNFWMTNRFYVSHLQVTHLLTHKHIIPVKPVQTLLNRSWRVAQIALPAGCLDIGSVVARPPAAQRESEKTSDWLLSALESSACFPSLTTPWSEREKKRERKNSPSSCIQRHLYTVPFKSLGRKDFLTKTNN